MRYPINLIDWDHATHGDVVIRDRVYLGVSMVGDADEQGPHKCRINSRRPERSVLSPS